MLKHILIFIYSLLAISIYAQNNDKNSSFSDGLGTIDYSFNIGTQVGTSFNNSYYLSNYFSPNAKLNLSKRFSIIVGVGAAYTQMNNMPIFDSELNTRLVDASKTSFFTHASGIYKLTHKVNLNATILFEEALINIPSSPTLNKQYKDVSFGVNYNVNKHVTINAQMQFSDRPYMDRNNNMGFGMNSPFGYSPFY